MSACSPFEPIIIEPERSDLQLTVDTLKTSMGDAQQTVAELRAELDARRQELADVQIARAQLEGRIREADRRLAEARHVIDLQREELASSRSEREQGERTRAALQNQLKQLQKQLSSVREQIKGNVSPAAMVFPRDEQPEVAAISHQQDALLAVVEEATLVVPRPKVSGATPAGEVRGVAQPATMATRIQQMVVKHGDTLWSIARRYHTSVRRLMVRNTLASDRIQVGQTLWLTESPIEERERM
jgi:LysM repeat protein